MSLFANPAAPPTEDDITKADIGKTYQTTNYAQLRKNWNRPQERVDLNKLKKSIEAYGQKEPITITADFFTIDGGHRVTACEELKIPVIYTRQHYNFDDKAMIIINNQQKKWNWRNYVDLNIHNGLVGWKEVRDMINKYDINYTTLVDLGFATNGFYNKSLPIDIDFPALEKEIINFLAIVHIIEAKWGSVGRRQDVARAVRIRNKALADFPILNGRFKHDVELARMQKYTPDRVPQSAMDVREWMQFAFNRNKSKNNKTRYFAG